MAAFKFNLMFLIILSLQLCAAILLCNGMSMTLHTRRSMRQGLRVKEPLYHPEGFMEYYIKLTIGTPARDVLLVMDTGSDVVWASCTPNYTCTDCPGYTTVFLHSESSSALPVQCGDQKCKEVCEEGFCFGSIDTICSGTCPDYALYYGSGNTTGHLLTETLSLPMGGGQIPNFGFGCSVASFGVAGIAGFGRGNLSLPSQVSAHMGDKFAYCLNDRNNSSSVISLGDTAVPTNLTLNYTPFLDNSKPAFIGYKDFYYLGLQGVSIGGKSLTMPSTISTFDNNGNGGTIIDSGTSFTIFPQEVYDEIATAYVFLNCSPRAPEVEATTGFELCFNVSGVAKGMCSNANIPFPEIVFHFSGGSDMVLPHDNCFVPVTSDAVCLAFSGAPSSPGSTGPAAILGNYQQNNFYILYDREMNRLGFTQQAC